MSELVVALGGREAGTLTRSRSGSLSFTYAAHHVSATVPLSPSMPIREQTYRGSVVESYFAGLLPDDDAVRGRWAARFGVADRTFDLLAHMGLECAGAVQLVAPDKIDQLNAPAALEPVGRADIGARLARMRAGQQESWTQPDEHWSLAGAQAKFTLTRVGGQWSEARGSAATTHILKPGISAMRHQAVVEFATMQVSRRLGLSTAEVTLEDFAGEIALVVRRFDRVERAGSIRRLHQVDLCQASGVHPRDKYESRGGPSGAQLASLIRRTSTRPEADLRAFSDALVFNFLAAAPDGHSKNMAMLFAGAQARLAPLYDLATGAPYDRRDADTTAAFSVGGVRRFGEAYAKHWRRHARDLGLAEDERLRRVKDLAERLPDAFHDVLTNDVGGATGKNLWLRLSDRPGRLVQHCKQTTERIDRGS